MNRLQAQYQRLYLPRTAVAPGAATAHPSHPEPPAEDTVRALVLALRNPADWDTLAPVWRGVQADLAWPAPAIAVNGVDAFELWFSLAQPVPRAEAAALLHHLCLRYLPSVKPERLPRWPSLAAAALPAPQPGRIPALHPDTGRWSAFVAPDLPAVFGDDPSLDFPPGEDAQAELLSRLGSIQLDDWQAALVDLQSAAAEVGSVSTALAVAPAPPADTHHAALVGPYQSPSRFLLDVLNDTSVALVLRIDAAKALLPYESELQR
jgi:hypothetical protein